MFLIALSGWAAAQNIPSVGDTTTPAPAQPGHALIEGPHETVNPANGQVSLRFPVRLRAGKGGFSPHFAVAYDSAGAHFVEGVPTGGAFIASQQSTLASGGWSYTAPLLTYSQIEGPAPQYEENQCELSTEYVFQDVDGARHSFYLSTVGNDGLNDGHPCSDYYSQFTQDNAPDGWLASTTAIDPNHQYTPHTVTVTSPEGTTMTFDPQSPEQGWVPTGPVVDRHGNPGSQDAITYSLSNGTTQALTITDTLGTAALTTSGFNQGTDTITPAGSSAWQATWESGGAGAAVQITQGQCGTQTAGPPGQGPNVIQTLVTPEGTYTFSYDSTFGLLNRITYPNGGYVRYLWNYTPAPSEAGSFYTPPDPNGPSDPCIGAYAAPVITDRYVSPNGSTESEHQHFVSGVRSAS